LIGRDLVSSRSNRLPRLLLDFSNVRALQISFTRRCEIENNAPSARAQSMIGRPRSLFRRGSAFRYWHKTDMPKRAIYVAIGGKADIPIAMRNVCFLTQSGHCGDLVGGTECASLHLPTPFQIFGFTILDALSVDHGAVPVMSAIGT